MNEKGPTTDTLPYMFITPRVDPKSSGNKDNVTYKDRQETEVECFPSPGKIVLIRGFYAEPTLTQVYQYNTFLE